MLIILTTLLGAITPFIPDAIRFFTTAGDRKHELEVLRLRMTQAGQEHLWRMEEVSAQADIEETKAIRQPQQSFGVQLLDKAAETNWPRWSMIPIFWLFSVIDAINSLVRPSITVAVVAFYMAYRWACVKLAQGVITGNNVYEAIATTWGENDWAILFMVLAYWFGDRVRQKFKQGK